MVVLATNQTRKKQEVQMMVENKCVECNKRKHFKEGMLIAGIGFFAVALTVDFLTRDMNTSMLAGLITYWAVWILRDKDKGVE